MGARPRTTGLRRPWIPSILSLRRIPSPPARAHHQNADRQGRARDGHAAGRLSLGKQTSPDELGTTDAIELPSLRGLRDAAVRRASSGEMIDESGMSVPGDRRLLLDVRVEPR